MSAMDVLVLLSHTTPRWKEQFGRVIVEAQACGIPVLGSDSGAIPQVIGDGGMVVPERSPAAVASAICELRADPSLLAQMADAGMRQVASSYSWRRVAERMRDIYLSIEVRRNRL
jgi:glycosyltransferase involved in cell wall biosynthesis